MKIRWTEPAVLDLESIKNYISRDSEYYAYEFIARMFEAIEKLDADPKTGKKVRELRDRSIRELIFQGYRVVYRFSEEEILILAILNIAANSRKMKRHP